MEKIILVTGASSDVGIMLTKDICCEYSRIYLQYRTMNEALRTLIEELDGQIEVVPLQADFSNESDILRMIRVIQESGILPNHIVHLPAPKAYNKQFHKDNWERYELGWNIVVHSAVLILQAFIPAMVQARYGRIVFMLTSDTQDSPAKFQSSYVTVKYALLGLMKSLSVEYIDRGITVNGISPDMMETKFLSDLPQLIIEQNRGNSPLGRNVYVEEVIPVVRYMLSDLGAAMTGQNIGITGGL